MEQQPSTLAHHLSVTQCNASTSHDGKNIKPPKYAAIDELQPALSRIYFTRSAIFSALATSLVGFGIAPMALAETTTCIDTSSQIVDSQNAGSQNDDTQNTA
ncbi:MAG: translocation and assembly module TamA, partial [Psychrobacter glaciei]